MYYNISSLAKQKKHRTHPETFKNGDHATQTIKDTKLIYRLETGRQQRISL